MLQNSFEYYQYFHLMVTAGITCGLTHPIEWWGQAEGCLSGFMLNPEEFNIFLELALKDLYNCEHMEPATNLEQALAWVDEYYANRPTNTYFVSKSSPRLEQEDTGENPF